MSLCEVFGEYDKCKADIVYFAENYFKYVDIEKGLILIKLTSVQIRVLKELEIDGRYTISTDKRQIGKTTILMIKILHSLIFKTSNVIFFSKTMASSKLFLDKLLVAYSNLPKSLKMEIIDYNDSYIHFSNNSMLTIGSLLYYDYDYFHKFNCDLFDNSNQSLVCMDDIDDLSISMQDHLQLFDNAVINTDVTIPNFKNLNIRIVKKVFLGGTCNNSKWREQLIPMLTIDYFNPVVADWTEDCYKRELEERQNCEFCLYIITSEMTGSYSIAEVVDDSNKRPNKTVFCFLEDGFSTVQIKSLKKVAEMVKNNGATVFYDLNSVANYLNNS